MNKPTTQEILEKYYNQRSKRGSDQALYQRLLIEEKCKNSELLYDKLVIKGLKHEIIDCKNELTKINKIIKKLENL
jgi:hypothetical protein